MANISRSDAEAILRSAAGGVGPSAGDVLAFSDIGWIFVTSGILQLTPIADADRPAAGVEGRVIFNSDDGNLNIDNGVNWILPDGTIT